MSGNSTIVDGRTGQTAQVDSSNRLATFATSRPELTNALLRGDAFIITTGKITLTSGNQSAVLYVQNTDTVDWIINRWFINTADSDAPGDYEFDLVKNSGNGTIIDSGTDIPASNLNFGSARTLNAIIKQGAEGLTVTDGETVVDSIVPTDAVRTALIGDSFIAPPGSNFTTRIIPPVGNTSQKVQVGYLLHRRQED